MTIEARITFLGIPVNRRILEPGEHFSFRIWEVHADATFPIDVKLDVVSPDKVNISKDISAVNEMIPPTRRQGRPDVTFHPAEKEKIDGAYIPSKIPGVKTELKWSPPTPGEIITETLLALVREGQVGAQLKLLEITQRARTVVRLSSEFSRLLREKGLSLPYDSVYGYSEIEPKTAKEFLESLMGTSPKGMLGGWKMDENTTMVENGLLRVTRTIKENPNDILYGFPVISYTLQRDLTAD